MAASRRSMHDFGRLYVAVRDDARVFRGRGELMKGVAWVLGRSVKGYIWSF